MSLAASCICETPDDSTGLSGIKSIPCYFNSFFHACILTFRSTHCECASSWALCEKNGWSLLFRGQPLSVLPFPGVEKPANHSGWGNESQRADSNQWTERSCRSGQESCNVHGWSDPVKTLVHTNTHTAWKKCRFPNLFFFCWKCQRNVKSIIFLSSIRRLIRLMRQVITLGCCYFLITHQTPTLTLQGCVKVNILPGSRSTSGWAVFKLHNGIV